MSKKEYNKKRWETYGEIGRAKNKAWINSQKHNYCVYYLPEEHYVGTTDFFKRRVRQHNSRGKIALGAEIIAYFNSKNDALTFERAMHNRGYNGGANASRKK